MRLSRRRHVLQLLLAGAGTLLVVNSIGSIGRMHTGSDEAQQLAVSDSPDALGPLGAPAAASRSTRAAVVRHSRAPPVEAAEADLDAMVLSEVVQEETAVGSGVWRASSWQDSQFSATDLTLLRGIVTWVTRTGGSCERLKLMGAPKRTGNGVRPEQAVCADKPALPGGGMRKPCLVYQLGLNGDWSLAEQLARTGCEVFVLDHRERTEPEGEHSYHVQFRRVGVGRNEHVASCGGRVLTLDGLLAELGHRKRQLFLLRADLNGLETDMLLDQLVDPKSRLSRRFVLDRVDQLSLRLHLRSNVEHELSFYRTLARALRRLDEFGYRVVHTAPYEASGRWQFPGQQEPITLIHDVLLVRKQPASSRFTANMV